MVHCWIPFKVVQKFPFHTKFWLPWQLSVRIISKSLLVKTMARMCVVRRGVVVSPMYINRELEKKITKIAQINFMAATGLDLIISHSQVSDTGSKAPLAIWCESVHLTMGENQRISSFTDLYYSFSSF